VLLFTTRPAYLSLLCSTFILPVLKSFNVGRDSSVGIVTRYGLDGLGSNADGGRDFSHPSNRPRGPPSLLCSGYRAIAGGEAAGAWRQPPTQSSDEVQERLKLYLYSPCVS